MADNFIEDLNREIDREREEAFKAGIARINDPMLLTGPDYVSSYRIAADQLFEKIKTEPGMLDLIAIPYLQVVRHTVELLMESLLNLVIQITQYRTEQKSGPTFEPSLEMLKAAEDGHDLKHLRKCLKDALERTQLGAPADSLVKLVDKIVNDEPHHTAFRYPWRKTKEGKIQSSFKPDTPPIEIFAMHEAFEAFLDDHVANFGDPEDASVQGLLEQELYSLHLEEMRLEREEAARDAKNTAIRNTLVRLSQWLQEQRKIQSAEAATFNACANELKKIFAEEMEKSREKSAS